ncbi:MBL fold metallo-hydrolase [Actinomycetospora sp.]|jgi:glyoxylase-like metal-dependent hydrolase (beta-lactamase superfamily II)|uniref:MBL fold metallo-hydrolase n=1 Tax=Actinomycetospora sp. TaxID=1872135 RepID=UPI002F3EE4C6
MDVVDLRPDLRMLVGAPGQAYLVRTPRGVVLVDTGAVGNGESVAAALRDWGLDRGALRLVLITHWHADHAGSAAEIGRWPGVDVAVHRADAPVVRGTQPGHPPVLTPAEEVLHAQVAAGLPDAPPARVDREFDDAAVLGGAHVVATPGHTDGSAAFWFPDSGVLCTGDTAASHDGAVILGPFNADRARARESFRLLGGLGASAVCFGHGPALLGEDTRLLREAAAATTVPDPLGE